MPVPIIIIGFRPNFASTMPTGTSASSVPTPEEATTKDTRLKLGT